MQTGIFSDLIDAERERLLGERRSSLENPQTPLSYPAEWLLDIFNGGRTDAGIRVSEMTALQVITFLSGVDFIAGKISSLPLHVQERSVSPAGRATHRTAYEHDLYDIIHLEPNEEMTRQTLLKAFLIHCLAWGNGYIEIQRDAGNSVLGLWPLNPARTKARRLTVAQRLEPERWRPFPVNLPSGTLVFESTDQIQDEKEVVPRIIPKEDVLHVPGVSLDGRLGQSTVWLARQVLGLALATEKYGAKYFANYARPGGILEIPMNLKPEDREKSRMSWQEAQGGENSNRVAVLPPGFKWTPTSNKPEEAQAIETRQFIRTEIAALLHLPVRVLGDTSRTSKGSTEQENQEILDYSFSPWIEAIKQEWKRKLFPHSGIGRRPKNPFFIDFDVSELIRADAASREKFYASGRQWGYLTPNDVLAMERMNPIQSEIGEQYWMPVNMTLATTPINPQVQDGAGNGAGPEARVFERMFRDAFGRICARSRRDQSALLACFGPLLYCLRDLFKASALREMRVGECASDESDKFVLDYLGGMAKRAGDWDAGDEDRVCGAELERAGRALRVAAYREVASAKAREPLVIA